MNEIKSSSKPKKSVKWATIEATTESTPAVNCRQKHIFKCDKCGKNFRRQANYTKHQRSLTLCKPATPLKTLICVWCHALFENINELSAHYGKCKCSSKIIKPTAIPIVMSLPSDPQRVFLGKPQRDAASSVIATDSDTESE